MSNHYGLLDPLSELYGTPEKYDAVLQLPLIPNEAEYSRANIKSWNDRASLNVPPTPGGSYYWPSPLITRRVQLLATPHQLRKNIVNYRPYDSPIGANYGTWTGIPQQKLPLNIPGPNQIQEIDAFDMSNFNG